jgi:hypothetical protein
MKFKLYIYLLLFTTAVFAQQKRVLTSVDSVKVKTGAQINLTLKTTVDTLSKVTFPSGTHFGSLEILETYPTDTIKENFKYHLIKKYGLTQWDSGKYVIPRLQVVINNKQFYSDSITVEIEKVIVDTLKQHMYDIKDIINPPDNSSNWWKYLIGLLLLTAIGYAIYKYIQKQKTQKVEEIVYATPIEKANAHLKSLEHKHLIERGEIKEYYSELTDIARTYIEEAIEIPAMESTTNELISALKNSMVKKKLTLSKETLENLEKVLKQADLVKFAKSKPVAFEIADDRSKIEATINNIHQSIPEIVEEEVIDSDVITETTQKNKNLQKRNIIILSLISVFIVALIGITITKGSNYIVDFVFGNPSKELLEKEWVMSEYGNPPIRVETPIVLKRQDSSATIFIDPQTKDSQSFSFGSLTDDYYVLISTAQSKDSTEIDLNRVLDNTIKSWEKFGGQNILLKQEDFSTKEGMTGMRVYGTMTVLNQESKKSYRKYYEVLFFKQNQGLQQVHIVFNEGDILAGEVLERIINSVELGKVN